jgi:hypothetical protein
MEIEKVTGPVKVAIDPEFGLILTNEEGTFKSGSILGAYVCVDRSNQAHADWVVKIGHRHSEGKPRLWLIPDEQLTAKDHVQLHKVADIDNNIYKWLWNDPE